MDTARIGVTGSSQGGGLTVTTAALRPDLVKAAAAGCPYLCAFLDAIELTSTYPYQEINDYLRHYPDNRETVAETLMYFDGVNFADKVRCPIIINLGMQDNVVPTETGFMLYDAIGSGDKKLYTYDDQGHDAGRSIGHAKVVADFFERHLKGAS